MAAFTPRHQRVEGWLEVLAAMRQAQSNARFSAARAIWKYQDLLGAPLEGRPTAMQLAEEAQDQIKAEGRF